MADRFSAWSRAGGLTDHHEQRAFEDKQGTQTISPRGELRAWFSMAPQLAPCD